MKHLLVVFCFFLTLIGLSQLKIETDVLSINTRSDEFAPMYFNDGILITSNRKGSIVKLFVETDEEEKTEFNLNNVYYVKFKGHSDSIHNSIKPFHLKLEHVHSGPTSISGDDLLVVARALPTKSKKKKTRVGLYFYKKLGDKWVVDRPFQHNSSYYNLSHPSITPDGKTLYFVSNFKGGQGGMDIWKSELKPNNRWTDPVNLGPSINTKYNEVFPQVSDEVLYFSSNRPDGIGGYDIYYNNLINDEIKTLQAPINSTKDEYGLITNDHGHSGFFTTNRRNGNDDIFFFRRSINLPINCSKSVKTKMCYTFYDKQPLPNSEKVAYIWDFGDDKQSIGQEIEHCYSSPGDYQITLSLFDSTSNFLTENSAILDLKIEPSSDYFLSYKDFNNGKDIDVVLIDASHNDTVKESQDMYWKIGSEIIYDHDHIHLHPKYSGQYTISGYLKDKDNITCITDTVSLVGSEKKSDDEMFIHLVHKKDGMIFPKYIQEEVFAHMMDFPKQNKYSLHVPQNVTENWVSTVKRIFNDVFRQELKVTLVAESNDIILKIYE